jgi:hypothetical protein
MRKLETYFIHSVAVILFVAALAVLLCAFGSDNGTLDRPDPLLFLRNRTVFFLLAAFEIGLSGFLLAGKNNRIKLALTSCLATGFIAYRLGIWRTNGPNIYSCLGNLTNALPIHPRTLDLIITVMLGYLFFGAYAFLVLNWINRRKSIPACGISVQVPKLAEKPVAPVESNVRIPRAPQLQSVFSTTRKDPPFAWLRRLLLGWGIGVVLFGILLAALHIRSLAALPKNFGIMLNEVCSVGNIRGAPFASHDGAKLLYARETPKGLGFFIEDLHTLQRHQIGLVDKTIWTAMDYFTLIGWSPNNRYLAFRIETPHDQTLAICDGNTGSLIQTFSIWNDIRFGFWLTNDSLILMDFYHRLLIVDLKQPSRVHELYNDTTRHNYTTFGIDSQRTSYALAKMSDHSFAYAERGNVWALDLSTGQTNQLTHLANKRIEWLDYSAVNDEFLFCLTDPASDDPESIRYLYRLNPNAADTNKLTCLTSAGTFKGQWIYGGTGISYVGTKGAENYLAVETEDKSLCTNLFVGGNVLSYGVSPQRDKIYAVASLGHEPLGIWEYDIAGKNLRNVLPGMERPYTVSQFIAPVKMSVTKNGENIPYFMLPPAGLDPHKKYPVLIDQPINDRCEPGPQFLANAGIFYVSVNRHGLASSDYLTTAFSDALAVYDDLVKNPNVDPHRIYIAGVCASTTIVSQLIDYNPAMWRGALFLGPNSFPAIPAKVAAFPSIFVSVGKDDTPLFLTTTEAFAREASRQLIPMRIVCHENAGHIFNSTSQTKERYGAAAKFILTDY